jgi:hypothetical protein
MSPADQYQFHHLFPCSQPFHQQRVNSTRRGTYAVITCASDEELVARHIRSYIIRLNTEASRTRQQSLNTYRTAYTRLTGSCYRLIEAIRTRLSRNAITVRSPGHLLTRRVYTAVRVRRPYSSTLVTDVFALALVASIAAQSFSFHLRDVCLHLDMGVGLWGHSIFVHEHAVPQDLGTRS